jgi:uncharacterized membrane protein (DUF106 family)
MENTVEKIETTFKNPYVLGALAMFVAFYGPRLQPRLPESIRKLFNSPVFRFIILVLIVYLSSNNLGTALMVSIAYIVIMNLVTMLNTEERFQNQMEHFQSEMESVHQREAVAREKLEKVVEMTPEEQMDLIQKSVEKEAKKYANIYA